MTSDGRRGSAKGVKRVRRVLADGTLAVYHYDRITGRRVLSDADPNSPAFDLALRRTRRAGVARKPKAGENVWKKIADAYWASPEYLAMAPRSRRHRDRIMYDVIERFGFMRASDLDHRRVRDDFYALRDELAATPSKADAYMDTIALLVQFAYDRGLANVNHALRIRRLAREGTRKDIILSPEQEARLLADPEASPRLKQALRLALLSAARVSDMCRLRRSDYRDGWLGYTPAKTARATGARVWLPVFLLPPLQGLLGELIDGPTADDALLAWDGPRGLRPLQPGNLDHLWRPWRDRALGPVDLHWHDIRGTGITRLYEAGCTDAEVASVSGHARRTDTSLRDYQARTKKLAMGAFEKLARGPAPDNIVQLATAGKRA